MKPTAAPIIRLFYILRSLHIIDPWYPLDKELHITNRLLNRFT